MDVKEKIISRHKLGLTIQRILEENKLKKDSKLVTSLRKLAASSGIEYAIIQKISSGKKDPQWTTVVSLADGFGITVSELCSYYEEVSDVSIQKQIKQIKKKKLWLGIKKKWHEAYYFADIWW